MTGAAPDLPAQGDAPPSPADGVQRTSALDAAASTPADDASPTDAPGFAANVAFPRGVRSFVVRAGRTTTGQARALAELGPRYVLPYDAATTDLVAACADAAGAGGQKYTQTVLEIGFGMGQATAHIAALRPDTLFIGCEVHEPGVGALLSCWANSSWPTYASCSTTRCRCCRTWWRPPACTACTSSFPTRGTKSATTSAA